MMVTYKTLHYGAAPVIGVRHYVKEIEIDGEVIETKVSLGVPCTNRGVEKQYGWLGSFSTGGCTKDRYSRGLCEVVSVDEIGENHYEIVWSPVV